MNGNSPAERDLAVHEEVDDRGGGPEIGDYAGFPINDAARYKAEAYSPSWLTEPEHQCIPHPAAYQYHGPGELTFVREYDPATQLLVAYHIYGSYGNPRIVWMDGRPHPPADAPHSFVGFSTGKFEGDKLVVETTHMKASWIRRNGLSLSDQATMVEYFLRHDDTMTIVTIVERSLLSDRTVYSIERLQAESASRTQARRVRQFRRRRHGARRITNVSRVRKQRRIVVTYRITCRDRTSSSRNLQLAMPSRQLARAAERTRCIPNSWLQ